MLVNYHLRSDLPPYLWITSNRSTVPCYVTILPIFGPLISSSHRCSFPICLPANNDRPASSLWIWLKRFSHRHILKCETVLRITTSFWRLLDLPSAMFFRLFLAEGDLLTFKLAIPLHFLRYIQTHGRSQQFLSPGSATALTVKLQ